MLLFWKERLVFLAVPKTGTSAYEAALQTRASIAVLDPPELKHAPIYRYNRFFRPMFERTGGEDMETLAVVRDPLDWLGSWYRYRRRPFLDGKRTSTADVSFDAGFSDAMLVVWVARGVAWRRRSAQAGNRGVGLGGPVVVMGIWAVGLAWG